VQTWKITTPQGEQNVDAMRIATTDAGDLVLKRQDGEVLHAFAKGAWIECQLVKSLDGGYGPK
jgi:hypothetical protein